MSEKKLRIFLSSTTTDLGDIREELAQSLRRFGHEPIYMGEFGAASIAPIDKVLAEIASCDVYVGLFAFWYGEPIPGLGKSHTHMEYCEAEKLGKTRLVFLLEDEVENWKAPWFEKGERAPLMARLRQDLLKQDSYYLQFFKKKTDLLTLVPQAIQKHVDDLRNPKLNSATLGFRPTPVQKGEVVVGLRFQDVRCFKDRTEEFAQMRRFLSDPNVKLLSILGRSGTGKTALVSRFGEAIETGGFRLPEGGSQVDGIVYFVCRRTGGTVTERLWYEISRLLPTTNADELRKIWTDAAYSDEDRFRELVARFQHGYYLVFLDGFESVIEDATIYDSGLQTFLDVCLRTHHSLRVVITSETNFEMPHDTRHYYKLLNLDKGLPPPDAVDLLRSLDPEGELGFGLVPDELLLQVAQRCNGFPWMLIAVIGILFKDETLSIERMLADNEIWTKLLEVQYEQYPADDRRVLELLAVFDNPVPRDAVEFVVRSLSSAPNAPFSNDAPERLPAHVKQCLSVLVHGQVVTASRSRGTYAIQRNMQVIAYGKIPRQDDHYDRQKCHQLAADYFAKCRKPRENWIRIEDIQPQLDEFEHRIRGGQYQIAADLLQTIDEEFLQVWGRYQILIEMHEKLVGHLQNATQAHQNLGNLAISYRRFGRLAESISYFQQAIGNATGDAVALANWHTELGNTFADAVEMDKAFAEYQSAIDIAGKNGDLASEARALGNLAIAHRQIGQIEVALKYYDEAIQRDRERLRIAHTSAEKRSPLRWYTNHTGNRGKALLAVGRIADACECFDEAICIFQEQQNAYGHATFMHHKAEAALLRHDYPKAAEICERSVSQLSEIKETRNLSYALHTLALIRSRQSAFDEALSTCERGYKLKVPETQYAFRTLQGIIELTSNNQQTAQKHLEEAIEACAKLVSLAPRFYEALYRKALAELASGQGELSLASYTTAMSVCSAAGVRHAALDELELLVKVDPNTYKATKIRTLLERDLPPLC